MITEIRARDFGVRPGIGDVSSALRRLSWYAAGLSPGVRVIFERGEHIIAQNNTTHIYTVDPNTGLWGYYSTPLCFRFCVDLTLDFEGATFEHPGGYTTRAPSGAANYRNWLYPYPGMKFEDCRNVTVRNGTFIGGADNIIRGLDTTTGQLHAELESSGVYVLGGFNFKFINVHCHAFINDGFTFDGVERGSWHELSERIYMSRCSAFRNARNGLTLAECRRTLVEDSEFSDTGRTIYGGHSPVAGLDVEPDRTPIDGGFYPIRYRSGKHVLRRCTFRNNLLRSVVAVYQRIDTTVLEDCVLESDSTQDYDSELRAPGIEVRRCTITGKRPRFGHEPSSTFGDDGRRATVEDNVIIVNGPPVNGECTIDGARLDFRRNQVRCVQGLRAFSLACVDGSVIEENAFRTNGKWMGSIFAGTGGITFRNNSFATDLGPSDFNLSNVNDRCWVFLQPGSVVPTGSQLGPFCAIG